MRSVIYRTYTYLLYTVFNIEWSDAKNMQRRQQQQEKKKKKTWMKDKKKITYAFMTGVLHSQKGEHRAKNACQCVSVCVCCVRLHIIFYNVYIK